MKHFFLTRPSPGYGEFHMLLVAASDEAEAHNTVAEVVMSKAEPE